MEIRVVDYYEDEASLFSSSDIESGEDGKPVSKYVVEANTVHTTTPLDNKDDDGYDYRWPTRSPLPSDNGDSIPYPNRTISNPNSGSGNVVRIEI